MYILEVTAKVIDFTIDFIESFNNLIHDIISIEREWSFFQVND